MDLTLSLVSVSIFLFGLAVLSSIWALRIFSSCLSSKDGILDESKIQIKAPSCVGDFLDGMNLPSIKITPRDLFLISFLIVAVFFSQSLYLKCFDLLFSKGSDEASVEYVGIFSSFVVFQLMCLVSFFIYKFFADGKFSLNFRETSFFQAFGIGAKSIIAGYPIIAFFNMAFTLVYFLIFDEIPERQEVVNMLGEGSGKFFEIALSAVSIVLLAPVFEEIFFRGFFYRALKGVFENIGIFSKFERAPRLVAIFSALIASAIFASIHFNAASWLALFVLAILLTLAYECSKNIKVPIIMHSVFNLVNFIFILGFSNEI